MLLFLICLWFPAHNTESSKEQRSEQSSISKEVNGATENGESEDLDTSKFASETVEREQESLAAYNEATASLNLVPEIESSSTATPKENGVDEDHREDKENVETRKYLFDYPFVFGKSLGGI